MELQAVDGLVRGDVHERGGRVDVPGGRLRRGDAAELARQSHVPDDAVLARLARGALAPEAVADEVSPGVHLAPEVHGDPGEHRVSAAVHEEHVVRVGDVEHLSREVAGVRHASLDGASRVAVGVLDETLRGGRHAGERDDGDDGRVSTSTRWSTGRSERGNFKFPGGVVVRRFGERKVTSNRRAEISAANRVERRARPPGSRDIDTYHAGVLEGREFGAEFREDARVDRGGTGAEVVLPFGGSLHVENPVHTMVSGVGNREGDVARGRGPVSVFSAHSS